LNKTSGYETEDFLSFVETEQNTALNALIQILHLRWVIIPSTDRALHRGSVALVDVVQIAAPAVAVSIAVLLVCAGRYSGRCFVAVKIAFRHAINLREKQQQS
jgi:hypothetical protein